MQVLDGNYEQTLLKDLMSKKGIVQKWSQDLDMYSKKGCFLGTAAGPVLLQQALGPS